MSESLEDLEERLRKARARNQPASRQRKHSKPASGLGLGMKVAADLVAAIIVGTVIGLALDRWLGTAPWLLVLFLILGFTAGIINVVRSAGAADAAPGKSEEET